MNMLDRITPHLCAWNLQLIIVDYEDERDDLPFACRPAP